MLYCLPVGSEYEDNHSSLSIAMAFNWINALLRGVTLTAVRTHVVMLMERLKMRHTAQVFIFYKYFDIGLFTSVYDICASGSSYLIIKTSVCHIHMLINIAGSTCFNFK